MARVKKTKAEKKNAPHFNIIDAMIIILVIAAVVGIYFRYNIIDFLTNDKNNDEYVVSFSVENVRYTTPNYIRVGDTVYFKSNGDVLGKFISESENQNPLNITIASEDFVKSSGEIVKIHYPDGESRVNLSGRLLCEGSYTAEGGFCIDGSTYIAAGQTIEVYTETVSFVLRVTSIELYAEEA